MLPASLSPQQSISFCLCSIMQLNEGHAGLLVNQLPRWRREAIWQTGHRETQQTFTGNCISCPRKPNRHKHNQSYRTETGARGSQVRRCLAQISLYPKSRNLFQFVSPTLSNYRRGCLERVTPMRSRLSFSDTGIHCLVNVFLDLSFSILFKIFYL